MGTTSKGALHSLDGCVQTLVELGRLSGSSSRHGRGRGTNRRRRGLPNWLCDPGSLKDELWCPGEQEGC
jgi:hypothetical protein